MERIDHFESERWEEVFGDAETYLLSPETGVSRGKGIEAQSLQGRGACFLVKTSGSSGVAKWVVHSKHSILEHAKLVNRHLGISSADVFGLVLPVYHVGGLGVIARALLSGARCVTMDDSWSAAGCVDFLDENKVSVVSLVPAQLVDIVNGGHACPESVRIVVVGGGRLNADVYNRAVVLGWMVSESYGMTETGSQIATGRFGESHLKLIDGWMVRVADNGMLEVKGECLFSGYLLEVAEGFKLVDPLVGGWFRTSDKVELLERDGEVGLKFLGRSDQMVKILGELVDVSALEARLCERLEGEVYLVPLEDERRGMRLYPVVADKGLVTSISELAWTGLERLERAVVILDFPRNGMGKLSRAKLVEIVESVVFSSD